MTSRDRFLDLMKKEILKLDLADLDFGIYRILRYRRDAIEKFFDDELPATLDEALIHEGEERKKELERKLDELRDALEEAASGLGFESAFDGDEIVSQLGNTPTAAEYEETREALEALDDGAVFAESEEDRLYNVLYTFFSRYYRDGDFQPQQRRARDARYSVPYNGEDVHFHWRSKGSHYVKTTEELKSYTFRTGGWRVRFELVEAFQEPDNVKGNQRYFFPVPEECRQEVGEDGNLFVVPFAFRRLAEKEDKRYKKKSDEVEGDSVQERIINDLAPRIELPKGVAKTDLVHHLHRYAKKNRTDYFVHPNLGPFLKDELDYFLKNEYLDIDGLTSVEAMADRLAKMRVLRKVANQIIDMLHEIESFQARLFEKRKFVLASHWCATLDRVPEELWELAYKSDAQRTEWKEMFGIEVENVQALREHQDLVIDTALLPRTFVSQFLESITDIEEASDGLAIHGDAWQGLRLIGPSYRGRVRCIYIDPPFNTETDQFAYKDQFRSSTWLSLISERIMLGASLLTDDGSLYVHLDHNSSFLIRPVLDGLFGDESLLNEIIWRIGWVSGFKTAADRFVRNHETLLLYGRNGQPFFNKSAARIPYRSFARETINEELKAIAAKWKFDLSRSGPIKVVLKDRSGFVWKLGLTTKEGAYNVEDTWNSSEYEELHSNKIKRNAAEYTPNGSAITQKPEQLLKRIVEVSSESHDYVLDFFAGTGTTAAVAKKLSRRFLVIEPGSYFDTDLLWRMKMVLFGRKVGISDQVGHLPGGLFQYVRIESFEDSLNSLTVGDDNELGADFHIRYVIPDSVDDSPCLLATERLEHPFEYQLQVHTEEGVQHVDVDLVTTFNLMKGIRPKRYREFDHEGRRYVVVEGRENGEEVLVIWRDVAGLDPEGERAFLQDAIPEALGKALVDYARVYHNADSALPNSVSLDAEFKRLMFEPEPALA